MNIDPKDIDLIERYLDGSLNPDDLKLFIDKLQGDKNFQKTLHIRKALPGLLEKTQQLNNTKQEVIDAIGEPKNQILQFLKPSYLAWAAVLVILVGTAIGYLVLKHSTHEQTISGSKTLHQGETIIISPGYKQAPKATKEIHVPQSGIVVSLNRPKNEAVFKLTEMIRFEWKYMADSTTHLYILSAGSDKIDIMAEIKPGAEVYTLEAKNLKAGRYYWFIGNKEVKQFFTIER